MSAFEIARAIANLETSASLLEQAAEALSKWDGHYDASRELGTCAPRCATAHTPAGVP